MNNYKIISSEFSYGILTKYKNEIYGIAILWIMIYHCIITKGIKIPFYITPVRNFFRHGNIGVEIFLLCAGIFLYFSYAKNPKKIEFYKKRFNRIFFSFFLINGTFWALTCKDFIQYFKQITLYSFWVEGDGTAWFVGLIILLYLIYPLIYKFIINTNNPVMLACVYALLIFALSFWIMKYYPVYYKTNGVAITRIPIFIIGCCIGPYVYQNVASSSIQRLLMFAISFIAICAFSYSGSNTIYYKLLRIPLVFFGVGITFFLTVILNFLDCKNLNKILSLFGMYSFELYLSHVLIKRILLQMGVQFDFILFSGIVILLSLITAWFTDKLKKNLILLYKERVK